MVNVLKKSKIIMLFNIVALIVFYIGNGLLNYRNIVCGEDMSLNQLDNNNDQNSRTIITALLIFLIIINLWSTIDYWIECMKNEIYIRLLSGASWIKMSFKLVEKYTIVYGLAFLGSYIFIEVLGYTNFFLNKYIERTSQCYIKAFACIYIIGILIFSIKLKLLNDKSIINIIK